LARTMTILALACCLVVGVAAAAMVGRDGIPVGHLFASPPPPDKQPVANRDGKADRLQVASQSPTQPVAPGGTLPEPLRQAFATGSPVDVQALTPSPPIAMPPLPQPRPKLANQLAQKNYSLLSDMQIAALKGRMQLTRAQEPYWPPVEGALRDVARKIHTRRLAAPGTPAALDSSDIEQIKTAAAPLLAKLREDQKREARSLARIIGLEAVASLI